MVLLTASRKLHNFHRGTNMKKLLLASIAGLALASGSASAADLARPVYKAPPPPPPPAYSWTGCYVDGGGGYGMWNQDSFTETTAGLVPLSVSTTFGGRGWFGQVGAGCDYQIGSSFLIGAFGDYDFMSLKGQYMDPLTGFVGQEKETDSWAVGGRLGYIALPGLLTYINGGYTQARFDQVNFGSLITGAPLGLDIAATTYDGWFLGGGTETSLSGFFGLGLASGSVPPQRVSLLQLLGQGRSHPHHRDGHPVRPFGSCQQIRPDALDVAGLEVQLGLAGLGAVLSDRHCESQHSES